MGGERTSGSDLIFNGGEDAGLLVRLKFAAHCFGGKEATVGWGGAANEDGVHPLSDEMGDAGAEG